MQETEKRMKPLKTAVIEFLDSLSLVTNDQKLAPNYGIRRIFWFTYVFHGDMLTRHIEGEI